MSNHHIFRTEIPVKPKLALLCNYDKYDPLSQTRFVLPTISPMRKYLKRILFMKLFLRVWPNVPKKLFKMNKKDPRCKRGHKTSLFQPKHVWQ